MENLKEIVPKYLAKLNERSAKSHIYRPHQWTGLELASLLNDKKHTALYMKLAKQHNQRDLLELAKRISENDNVRNKGAYFMKVFFNK